MVLCNHQTPAAFVWLQQYPICHLLVLFLFHLFSDPKHSRMYWFVFMETQKLESSELPDKNSSAKCYIVSMTKVLNLDHCHCWLVFQKVAGQTQFNSGQTQHFFSFWLKLGYLICTEHQLRRLTAFCSLASQPLLKQMAGPKETDINRGVNSKRSGIFLCK